ncbi:MAG: sensor histidine kinase [Chlorobi bacterium]|nr:sensor histidine kinase [Chlorobiota bacterium]
MDYFKQTFVFFLLFFASVILSAEIKIDTTNSSIKKSKTDSAKIEHYNQLYSHYITVKNDSALYYANKSLQIALSTNNIENITKATIKIANVNKYLGLYDTAIQIVINNLKNIDTRKHPILIADSYCSLGELNRASNQLENAIKYSKMALQLYIKLNDSLKIANCYNRLAAINFELSNLKKAIEQANYSINICKGKDENLLANNYEILGAIYTNKNIIDSALHYLSLALRISKQLGDNDLINNTLINISNAYLKNKQYNEAIIYGLKAHEMANKTNTLAYKVTSSSILAQSYLGIKNYKEAYNYKAISDGERLLILNKERDNKITELNTKYNINQKLQEIKNQKILIGQEKTKLKYVHIMNVLLAIGIIMLIIFLVILYFTHSKLKILNKELVNKNNKIEKQSIELKKANNELVELDKFKNEMTNMIVHDLKNPLGIIINYANFSDTTKALRVIKFSGYQTLNLVNNILAVRKYEEKGIKLDIQSVILHEITDKVYEQLSLLIEQKKINFINEIPKKIKVKADPYIVERIFVNILTNALKFTQINGKIIIKAAKINSFIKISISDNGYGIKKENMSKLFKKYGQINSQKEGTIVSTGLGLFFCKFAVEAHGGKINAESEYQKGSTFWFTLLNSD